MEHVIDIEGLKQSVLRLKNWTSDLVEGSILLTTDKIDNEISNRKLWTDLTWDRLTEIFKELNGYTNDDGNKVLGLDEIRQTLNSINNVLPIVDLGTKLDEPNSDGSAFARIADIALKVNNITYCFNTSADNGGIILDDKPMLYIFKKAFESLEEADKVYYDLEKPDYIKLLDNY